MANIIKIKRGSTVPSSTDLEYYELGYRTGTTELYINDGGTYRQLGGGATTSGSNNQLLTDDGSGGINSEGNLTFTGTLLTNTGDIKIASGSLGVNTNANGSNGRISATSHIEAGVGSGAIGLTINDGGGNSNVTFNHTGKVPEQNGNSGRIEVNTDGIGNQYMAFELAGNVTAGVSVATTEKFRIDSAGADVTGQLVVTGQLRSSGNGGFTIGNYAGYDRIQNSSDTFGFLTDGNAYANIEFSTVTAGTWQGTAVGLAYGGTGATNAHNARINLGLGTLAELSQVTAATIADNNVGAAELNVSGNGSSGQVLASDGDGSFSWVAQSGGNATTLDNLDSTQFLRSDAADTSTGKITFNAGIQDNTTHIGVVGGHGLDGDSLSTTDWANFPVGYRAMIRNTNGTTYGSPVNNYGYFLKVANRDSSGGWGGIWVGYSTGENYLGRTATSGTYASWEKIWTSANDGSGTGLDADLLDGVQGSGYATLSGTQTFSGAKTFGTQTWNGHITWNNAININVAGESSFDVSGGGVWQVWDSGTGAPFIMCDVGQRTEIGSAGSRGVLVHGEIEGSSLDISGNADIDGTANLDNTDIDGTLNCSGTATFTARTTFDDSGADGVLFKASDNSSNSSRVFFDGTSTSCIFQEGNDLSFRTGATTGSSSGTERMLINSVGNVKIGSGSVGLSYSNHGMEISGSGNQSLRLEADGDTVFEIAARTGDVLLYNTSTNRSLRFGVGGSEKFRINSDGNAYFYQTAIINTNNYSLSGRDTGGTVRAMLKIDTSNNILLGDSGLSGQVHMYPSNYMQVSSNYGWVQVGSQNSGWGHIQTDRASFYFNKKLTVDEGIVQSYNENLDLRRAQSSADRIVIEADQHSHYVNGNKRLEVKSDGIIAQGISKASSYFQAESSGILLRMYNSGWGNATTHDVIRNGYGTNLGDYVYLKTSGNSTTNHGIIIASDNYIFMGRDNLTTGDIDNSATAPITDTYFRLDASGNGLFDGDVVAYSTTIASDERLKENVKDLNYGLKDVLDIRPVSFDWIDKRDGQHDIGVIAQEIEKIIPEVVVEVDTLNSEDTHKTVDYAKLTSVLIKAVQEQQQQINELKEKLNV